MKIIFATKNNGKFGEGKKILEGNNIELLSLNDFEDAPDVVENSDSFEGNAQKKAMEIFNEYKIPVIADDSGLAVDQLNGEPGIFSARYSGENSDDKKNNKKLIKNLENFPEPHTARFICAAVYFDGKNKHTSLGKIEGKIIKEGRGTNGFGYDPHFLPDRYDKTMAELEPEIKNSISHRAKAFNELKKFLNTQENKE